MNDKELTPTEKGKATRERFQAERDAAKAQRDETRAAVLAALRRVTDNPDSTNAELLEAAKLAVEVQGRGY